MNLDTVTKSHGMSVLLQNLGMVETERFIMLMKKEPFDYTVWQTSLLSDKSIDEIHENATLYWKNKVN